MSKVIDIVLATYNGAKFLREQLDSIVFSERYDELVKSIIVTDDGSVDDTIDIVSEYLKYGVKYVKNLEAVKGPVGNFCNGLNFSDSEYVMFCDQDDVWCKSKIKKFYDEALELDDNIPGAVYCDLKVVDENLNLMNSSFFVNESIDPRWGLLFSNLLFQNCAPGCAMLINRAAIERVLPVPKGVVMHDWWFILFAALYKNVRLLNEPLVSYRQHQDNVVGASSRVYFLDFFNKFSLSIKNFKSTCVQVKRFNMELNEDERLLLVPWDKYKMGFIADIKKKSFLEKFSFIFKDKKIKSSAARNFLSKLFFLII